MLGQVTEALARLDRLRYPDDLREAASTVASVVRSLLSCSVVTVLLAEMPGSTIFTAVTSSARPGVSPITRDGRPFSTSDERLVDRVMRAQEPLFLADPARSDLVPGELTRRHRLGSVLCVPLPGEGGSLGMLTARWETRRGPVDPAVLRAVSLFANQAAHTFVRLRSARDRERDTGARLLTELPARARPVGPVRGV